jgi:NAD(P)-dependent dehydrogenase (short-subunit alcohol dehydrogenase family)
MTSATGLAVVTGAAQGLGLATALRLGAAGFALCVVDRNPPEAALRELAAAGVKAFACVGDVADPAFADTLAARVAGESGAASVLVNNAGISMIQRAEDTSLAQWSRVLEVNLTGPFLLCQALGRQMLAQGRGSIVNVASIAGIAGVSHRAAYNASKHGLVGLTRTLAAEWGGRGVRVNAVCPGWIKTEMDEADQGSGAYSDRDITDRVPMGRFARPEDVAEAIAFLADAKASAFVNGVALPVDGGWTADASWDSLRLKSRT